MDLSNLISLLHKELKYEYNLITKVGLLSRDKSGNNQNRYHVIIEFYGLSNLYDSFNNGKVYTLKKDSEILPAIVVGHIWTKKKVYQNIELGRLTNNVKLNLKEEFIFAESLHKILKINIDDKNACNLLIENLPVSYRMIFSRCFSLPIEASGNNDSLYDYILLPAFELIRFLFFKSSHLVPLILNGTVTDHCDLLNIKENSKSFEVANTIIIGTDRKYDRNEEYIFAEILSNEYINRSYKNISSYLNKVFLNKELSELSTVYPETLKEIYVCGIPFIVNNIRYFYTYQIYSIKYKPKYDSIRVYLYNDPRKGNEILNSEVKIFKNKKMVSTAPKGKVTFSEEAGNNASLINRIDFSIETDDKYNNSDIPPRIDLEKEIQNNQYNGKTFIIRNSKGEFTLSPEKSKDSKNALSKIVNKRGYEAENKEYHEGLLQVLREIKYEISFKYFDYKKPEFIYEEIINTFDKSDNKSALIVKFNKNNQEKVLMEFKGISTIRMVLFYRIDNAEISIQKVIDFIELILNESTIPHINQYKRENTETYELEEFNWDRLNISNLDDNNLKERIFDFFE